MLTPHACHNIEGKRRNNLLWCADCNVPCYAGGEDIGHYFDYKEKDYVIGNADGGCIKFLTFIHESLGGNDLDFLKDTRDFFKER